MNSPALIDIGLIDVEPQIQPRVAGVKREHVQVLEANLDGWAPIVVLRRGNRYVLIDGAHRVAAAQNLGVTALLATVLEAIGHSDLRTMAFQYNVAHGLPLTLDDRRSHAVYLLNCDSTASNMEVARQAGLAPTTVATIRDRLERAREISPSDQRVARDGTTHTVSDSSQSRPLGALPDVGLGETIGDLFSSADRKRQRKIVSYFQRLAVALVDQYDLEGFETIDNVPAACTLVLGTDKAHALACVLGPAAHNVLAVARVLGYEPAGDEA